MRTSGGHHGHIDLHLDAAALSRLRWVSRAIGAVMATTLARSPFVATATPSTAMPPGRRQPSVSRSRPDSRCARAVALSRRRAALCGRGILDLGDRPLQSRRRPRPARHGCGVSLDPQPPRSARARDLAGAVTSLAARPDVRAAAIGITGFCMGGQYALMAACRVARPRRLRQLVRHAALRRAQTRQADQPARARAPVALSLSRPLRRRRRTDPAGGRGRAAHDPRRAPARRSTSASIPAPDTRSSTTRVPMPTAPSSRRRVPARRPFLHRASRLTHRPTRRMPRRSQVAWYTPTSRRKRLRAHSSVG